MNRIESKFKRPKPSGICDRNNLRRAGIVLLGMAFGALFVIKSEFTADVPEIPSDVELKASATIVVKNSTAKSSLRDKKKSSNEDDDDQLPLTWEEAILKNMTQTKQTQIENYRKGTALMLNVHATHHAGTSFCSRIGRIGGKNHSAAPGFACMHDKDHVFPSPEERGCSGDEFCKTFDEMSKKYKPWSEEQTGPFVEAIRPYFHMTSWEFSKPSMIQDHHLDDPDWDYPNLLSVIITRHPLSRLLAGDGGINKVYPGYNTGELSRRLWWDYAAYGGRKESDNFFLRILASKPRGSQRTVSNHVAKGINRTTDEVMRLFPTGIKKNDFNKAKYLMDKMTIVLDIECLTEGMEALGFLLGLDLPMYRPKPKHLVKRPTPREMIGYDDVYEYLEAKHKWDIALYEYSKTISLVKCDELEERLTAPTKKPTTSAPTTITTELATENPTPLTASPTTAATATSTTTAPPTTTATDASTTTASPTKKPVKTPKKTKNSF